MPSYGMHAAPDPDAPAQCFVACVLSTRLAVVGAEAWREPDVMTAVKRLRARMR
jgi:hypothetical protein